MGDVGRVQDVGSPWDMLLAVPPVVRYYFVGMVIVTVGSIFGIVSPSAFVLDWNSVVGGLQIWRCFFTFFHLGKLSMQTIMLLMILFQQGVYLEKVTFSGSTPDYLFFLGFSGLLILAMDFFFPSYILAESMLFAMLQVWSRHNSNQPCKFLYVLTVKAAYLPLCFVALELVLSGGRMPWALIKGIVAGQVFYFLTEIYPRLPGKSPILRTPKWLYDVCERSYDISPNATTTNRSRPAGMFTNPPSASAPPRDASSATSPARPSSSGLFNRGGHKWGSGNRLGS